MLKKIILIILFLNIFLIGENCQALDSIESQLNFNPGNIGIPFTDLKGHGQEVQEILIKTEQLESKVQGDKETLKTLLDQKKAEYREAKKNYNNAKKQLRAVQAAKRKLQRNF